MPVRAPPLGFPETQDYFIHYRPDEWDPGNSWAGGIQDTVHRWPRHFSRNQYLDQQVSFETPPELFSI